MTDHPIIFSAPMIQALLAGRKTMTRRLAWRFVDVNDNHTKLPSPWQRVKPGDWLWVRENVGRRAAVTLLGTPAKNGVEEAFYAADGENVLNEDEFNVCPWWKQKQTLPCIHMPRKWSRLTFVVAATKIEPLQDISEADAKAEGADLANTGHDVHGPIKSHRTGFVYLWAKLHGEDFWLSNPEVVAITFAVHKQNIDAMENAS